jgi:beta-galactosidase
VFITAVVTVMFINGNIDDDRLVVRHRLRPQDPLMEDNEGVPVLISQGKLFYLTASGDRALMQRIADYLIAEADLPILSLPAGVRARSRGGHRIYVNYSASGATLSPASDESR